MTYTVDWFVEGEYYGEGQAELYGRDNRRVPSRAWICRHCGEIWARAVVAGEMWIVSHGNCSKCHSISILDVPGSIWLSLEVELMNSIPRELLLREFDMALAYNNHLDGLGVQWNSRSSVTEAVHGPIACSAR